MCGAGVCKGKKGMLCQPSSLGVAGRFPGPMGLLGGSRDPRGWCLVLEHAYTRHCEYTTLGSGAAPCCGGLRTRHQARGQGWGVLRVWCGVVWCGVVWCMVWCVVRGVCVCGVVCGMGKSRMVRCLVVCYSVG